MAETNNFRRGTTAEGSHLHRNCSKRERVAGHVSRSANDHFYPTEETLTSKTISYVYGGLQWRVEQNKLYGDIWILSIPAFTWFKLDVVGTLRTEHECVIVGSQLISVGGMGIEPWLFDNRDEWRQGIGVLDLTTMTWADRYTPNSTAYKSPQMVKDWYRNKYGEERCDVLMRTCWLTI